MVQHQITLRDRLEGEKLITCVSKLPERLFEGRSSNETYLYSLP